MPYRVARTKGCFEVRLFGEASEHDVIGALRELRRLDPGREFHDLWIVEPECAVPIAGFPRIMEELQRYASEPMGPGQSAVVVSDELTEAMVRLYCEEASFVPYQIRLFRSRDEALAWLNAAT